MTMSITKAYKKKKINPSDYVNIHTGQPLVDEYGSITSVNIPNNDLVIVSSNEYFIIDSEAMRYIADNFSSTEVGRITKMANMVSGCYNVLHSKQDIPHTNDTLMEEIEYTRDKFSMFMKKLHRKHVIAYLEVYSEDEKLVRHIMLNPTLARKSKGFHPKCTSVFQNLSKK